MTVCIAALCRHEGEPRGVVATDRMVTTPGFIEYEHPGSKIVELSSHALVMVAGNTNDGMRLVHDAQIALGGSTPDIESVADLLGKQFAAKRQQRAEQFVLKNRGLDMETFYRMHNTLNPQVAMLLDDGLAGYALGVDLLSAGVDDTGGHIYTNGDPGGGNTNHDTLGWAATGSGAVHVVPSMAGYVHSADSPFGQTLFRVYASKRRAEVAPGVGHETDMAVISRDGIKRLSDAELADLDSIYEDFLSTSDNELQKRLDSFDPERQGENGPTQS